MTASELFKASKLSEAIDAQVQEVKADPADKAKRLFLFELLAFSGELDRARRQIDALNYEEPELLASIRSYRLLLDSEAERRQFFTEGKMPQYLDEVPFHARLRMDAAMNWLSAHAPTGAANLLAKANESGPTIAVEINGKSYQTFRDADDLFGTILEVMAQGKYYWLPLEQVSVLAMNPPKFPRDLLWIPARIELANGTSGEVHLAAIYPNSSGHPDDQVKLGRLTDWIEVAEGCMLGIGQRTFLADEDALNILDWRELRVTSVS